MSYSVLREIESCPLRWALSHATYPELWTGPGYPPSPAVGTVSGQVVHLALETIVRAAGEAGKASGAGEHAQDGDRATPVLIPVLRTLGGISAVLERAICEAGQSWESNPRLGPRAVELTSELRRQVPVLRSRVQQFLNRVDLTRVRSRSSSSADETIGERDAARAQALGPGLYAEVPLVNDDLGWYGRADLLRVADPGNGHDDVEIIDFKTGAAKADHRLQLRIYALLWARDRRRNPTGRPARKLTVLYRTGPLDVPAPTTDLELNQVAEELSSRTADACAALKQEPPHARPSPETCEWCDVRHMCSAYWAPPIREAMAASQESTRQAVDAGVHVLSTQGAWSWIAQLRELGALSNGPLVGARILLRARPHDAHFSSLITVGSRLRLLSAQLSAPSDESGGLPVLSLTRSTEAFVVVGTA